ncbi:MAG: T9SS type A sorting domain-containing protein [candidate division WOR-3 bacterium]
MNSKVFASIVLFGTAALALPLWVNRYNGPANSDEMACAVLTDAERNVIVVGSSPGTTTAYDIVVLKYSPNGDSLWARRIAGPGYSNDIAKAAVLDASGAVYITATTGTYPDYNIMTLKINANGTDAWSATYQGSAGKADEPAGIAVDDAGNVYVTGNETNADNVTDIVTIKYSSSGSREWFMVFDGGATDVAAGIRLGPGGTVYVAGSSVQGSYTDYVTIKYTSNGAEAWSEYYNGSGNAEDAASGLAVAADGSVFVTGKSATAPPPGGRYNWVTVKYDANGSRQWAKTYTGANAGAEAYGLALGSNALYVFGKVMRSGNADYGLVAYNPNTGDTLWVRVHNSQFNKDDVPSQILLDGQGKIHLIGSSKDANSRSDYYHIRYSSTGVFEGTGARYNSPYDNDDQGVGIAVDDMGQVVVTGVCYWGVTSMNYDIVTVKYDSAAPGIAEARVLPKPAPGLVLAPNPAPRNSWVNLLVAGEGTAQIRVYDAAGAVVRTDNVRSGADFYHIGGLQPGVYLVEVNRRGRSQWAKLVVE